MREICKNCGCTLTIAEMEKLASKTCCDKREMVDIHKTLEQNRIYREALCFYADIDNWESSLPERLRVEDMSTCGSWIKSGRRAREAITKAAKGE